MKVSLLAQKTKATMQKKVMRMTQKDAEHVEQ
jgi:hypothetical protein